MNDNLKGACFMMGSMATFTLNDAALKWLAESLPAFQVVVLRGVVATVLILLLAQVMGVLRQGIPAGDRKWALARAVAEAAAFLPFVIALQHMPLANLVAILAALPLSITAAGAIFLGEEVGWRRWTAVCVGFIGVLLIVRPGTAGFDGYSLLGLLTVVMATVRDLVTRRLSRGTPSLNVAVLTSIAVTLLGVALSISEPWRTPTGLQGGLIVAAALFIVGAYLMSIMAMRVGEVAAVTPFRYTSLIWGLLMGWLIFGDWPAPLTFLGAAIIAGTGIYTLLREGRVKQAIPARPGRGPR
ncbi:DMT family transporter [Jannaschia pohangensis]|uniref:S-adenosylmethionine uptake transporter n=1 Tax=Jannaschia pohangensis TaxID=390807 RepID=A0A1I3UZL1_9RHOB|nr:DMT family transporter [Jannaschia pohangensis]SFJ88340.1 S-adenosylmethionine uptake transporter [Jannaschia pohangensis]